MRLVEENHTLEGAGLCFICEGAIAREKQAVVDTNHDFDPSFQHPLAGRKYICQGCAETVGYAVGMVKTVDVANAKAAIDQTRSELVSLTAGLRGLTTSLEAEASKVLNLPVLDLPDIVIEGHPEEAEAVTEPKEKKSGAKKNVPDG